MLAHERGRWVVPRCPQEVSGLDISGGAGVEVHGPCDGRITLYPAAPFRLAIILHAWTIAHDGWGSSQGRQLARPKLPDLCNSHTSDPPSTPIGALELLGASSLDHPFIC